MAASQKKSESGSGSGSSKGSSPSGQMPLGELLRGISGLAGAATPTGPKATATALREQEGLQEALLNLRDKALRGDSQAELSYNQAVDALRSAAEDGRQDASDLLDELGETIYPEDME